MKVQYFEEPTPHFIIDDFMTNQANKKIFEEIVSLEKDFVPGILGDRDRDPEIHDMILRNNKIVLFDHDEKYDDYYIRKVGVEVFNNGDFHTLLDSKTKSIFPIINHCNEISILLGSYGMCDFAGWHIDVNEDNAHLRILTACYYVNHPDAKFSGGEILLAHPNIEKPKEIKPKNNRLVLFHSKTLHKVNHIIMDETDFSKSRFVVNYWLGIAPPEV